jgi:hypothetical protein
MARTVKTEQENKIYALHYEGKLLGTFKWETTPQLHGWRPPKKVYYKLGLARSGANFLPKEVIDKIEIVEYGPVKVVEKLDSKEIAKKKKVAELKKKVLNHNWNVKYYSGLILEREKQIEVEKDSLSKAKYKLDIEQFKLNILKSEKELEKTQNELQNLT